MSLLYPQVKHNNFKSKLRLVQKLSAIEAAQSAGQAMTAAL